MKHHFNYLLLCNKSPLSGLNQKQSFCCFQSFLQIRNLGKLNWTVLAWMVVGQWLEQLGVDWHLSVFMETQDLPICFLQGNCLELPHSMATPQLQQPDPQRTRWKLCQCFWSCLSSHITSTCLPFVTGGSQASPGFRGRGGKLPLDEKTPGFWRACVIRDNAVTFFGKHNAVAALTVFSAFAKSHIQLIYSSQQIYEIILFIIPCFYRWWNGGS